MGCNTFGYCPHSVTIGEKHSRVVVIDLDITSFIYTVLLVGDITQCRTFSKRSAPNPKLLEGHEWDHTASHVLLRDDCASCRVHERLGFWVEGHTPHASKP